MTTLSQRFGSVLAKSRAKICPQKRQSVLLPPSINRGRFHVLKEEISEAKVKKTIFLPNFSFSPSRPPLWPLHPPRLNHCCHHQHVSVFPPNTPGMSPKFSLFFSPPKLPDHCILYAVAIIINPMVTRLG